MMKVVLKLDLVDEKTKQKALKNISGLSGIETIAMDSKDKKLTLTGDIDPVNAVAKLRKLCPTEIVSVGPAKEPEKKKEEPTKKEDEAAQLLKAWHAYHQQHPYYNQTHYQAYSHPQAPAYYGRSVEEDPNACVIC